MGKEKYSLTYVHKKGARDMLFLAQKTISSNFFRHDRHIEFIRFRKSTP
jgi:hypothetical protein